MGQSHACVQSAKQQIKVVDVPSYTYPWSIVHSESISSWPAVAGCYGFVEQPYTCLSRDCDRDSICLKKARAVLKKSKHSIEIQRYKSVPVLMNYGNHAALRSKVAQGFQFNEVIAAMKDSLVLLIFYRWERLQYEAAFVLVDLQKCSMCGYFELPVTNMTIIESKISPDGSRVAVLVYLQETTSSKFQYDLYIFSVETGKVLDILNCNTEVRPYVTFDPRFKWSRIAVVNYNNLSDIKNGLVLYCLEKKEVVAVSKLMLSVIYGGGYFCANYSRDGSFLVLQKISENMSGCYCYADSYIFSPDDLRLLRHYGATLQPYSTLCQTNYVPQFSLCSTRMGMINEEASGDLHMYVYQLPRPLELQKQCRAVILQNISSHTSHNIQHLPLPQRLKNFVQFMPET